MQYIAFGDAKSGTTTSGTLHCSRLLAVPSPLLTLLLSLEQLNPKNTRTFVYVSFRTAFFDMRKRIFSSIRRLYITAYQLQPSSCVFSRSCKASNSGFWICLILRISVKARPKFFPVDPVHVLYVVGAAIQTHACLPKPELR